MHQKEKEQLTKHRALAPRTAEANRTPTLLPSLLRLARQRRGLGRRARLRNKIPSKKLKSNKEEEDEVAEPV